MKKLLVLLTIEGAIAAFAFGQIPNPALKPAPAKAAKPAPKPASSGATLTVPKDAQRVDASTWRWVDPQGVAWIYRKTPFGLNHYKEDQAAQTAAPAKEQVKITDLGASYRFVRQTPFGPQTWEKNKSDLNDNEKRLVAAQRSEPSAAATQAPASKGN